MIKAPIGSGKSFLFFDGPTYALYKTSKRNLLNTQSKEGEISLIFSEGDNYYLIKRSLSKGKKYDSCASRLWAFHKLPLLLTSTNSEVLQRNRNLPQEILNDPNSEYEEIIMKNESDLQQSLDQLLPPEPVFLSTIFLLQDAQNIFEMQPAERLVVLKNVFGLLGIEESKDEVNEERKHTELKIKSLQDQSLPNAKLRKRLKDCYESTQILAQGEEKTFFEELHPLLDKITLQEFSLQGLNQEHFKEQLYAYKQEEKNYIALQATREQLRKQSAEKQQFLLKLQQEEKKLKQERENLEQRIARIDLKHIEATKNEKIHAYEQLKLLSNIGEKHVFEDLEANNLEELILLIQKLKERGKELFNLLQIQDLKKQEREKAKLRLLNFEQGRKNDTTFHCTKIQAVCPFVELINKQHFQQLQQQRSTLQEEVNKLEKDFRNYAPQPLQPQIAQIKNFLQQINFRLREQRYLQQLELQKQIQHLDQKILQMETELQQLHRYQQEQSVLLSRIQEIQKHYQDTEQELRSLQDKQQSYETQLREAPLQNIQHRISMLEQLLQTLSNIEQLIADFTETKNTLKHLQLRSERLKNLYHLLSKELLFSALGRDLPLMSEIINTYLTQVVDYQLNMRVIEVGDKIELEIKIQDSKGEREVKSLSGGQKTILKLVWMLAVASYLHTPLLFLDETITHLDADTVGKVSEMINNFVKQSTMKFYTVTHNQEIQEMEIRDDIITLSQSM